MKLEAYIQATSTAAMPLIEQCGALDADALKAMGAHPTHARQLLDLHTTYCGATSFSGKQRHARTAAHHRAHDMTTLLIIEGYVRRVKSSRDAWSLRAQLCDAPAGDIVRVAQEYFTQHKPPGPAPGVRFTRRKDGNHTLSVTASSLEIADMKAILTGLNPANALKAVKALFFDNPSTSVPTITTNVTLDLDQLDAISAGRGDDVILTLSNGGRISGAQLVTRLLAERGYVTLVHPEAGPVNLYRTQRLASAKQRQILANLYPRCVWPDCNKPVEECEIHHVKAWNAGGLTNINNLVPLCPHHNGANNDADIPGHRRGKIILRHGKPTWQPPR